MGIPVAPTAAPPLPTSAPPDEPPWVHLRLDDAVETALRHNLPVQIARLNRDTVEYEIPKAQAIFHPTVGMLAEATGEREVPEDDTESDITSRTGRAFVNELLPIGTNLQVSNSLGRQENETLSERDFSAGFLVTVRQPLLRGGGIVVVTRPVQDARFDLRVEEARLGAETLRVVAAAKSAYYTLPAW
jgi:outer membrane protein TolC